MRKPTQGFEVNNDYLLHQYISSKAHFITDTNSQQIIKGNISLCAVFPHKERFSHYKSIKQLLVIFPSITPLT